MKANPLRQMNRPACESHLPDFYFFGVALDLSWPAHDLKSRQNGTLRKARCVLIWNNLNKEDSCISREWEIHRNVVDGWSGTTFMFTSPYGHAGTSIMSPTVMVFALVVVMGSQSGSGSFDTSYGSVLKKLQISCQTLEVHPSKTIVAWRQAHYYIYYRVHWPKWSAVETALHPSPTASSFISIFRHTSEKGPFLTFRSPYITQIQYRLNRLF